MKVIYNMFLPPRGFSAMAFFGVILARKQYKPISSFTINHEKIHAEQAKECGGWVVYYLRYLEQWIRYGYRNCPFEKEAYDHDDDLDYLKKREDFAWKRY